MADTGAYGTRFTRRFKVEEAPTIVTRVLGKADIGVTELRADVAPGGESGSLPWDDAYLVAVQCRDYPDQVLWEGGKQAPVTTLRAGDVCFYDLKRDPRFVMDKPFHSIHFYLSRSVLDAVADESNSPRIDELRYEPGIGVQDATIRNLCESLSAGFRAPDQVSRLFMEHVTLGVAAHVAHTYAGLRNSAVTQRGGLAPWQLKRALEMLNANLDGALSQKDLAAECRLSATHFTRAFRQSTGVAPHQWLLQRRVESAKALLRDQRESLTEIALACGFADQSHFTRVFTRLVGTSPGAWQRSVL